ncbi:hypothetical protein GEW_01376 [Pasteurella multocida subsp. gallicida str. Anand1_poultry]|nr:hypothetical protein GEW_01376 [Pasteurella multocida subsp. gallicida str. Anand1_poultry]
MMFSSAHLSREKKGEPFLLKRVFFPTPLKTGIWKCHQWTYKTWITCNNNEVNNV